MSLDFLVVSGERSGSTWVANWLTTDTSICYHDPRLRWTQGQIKQLKSRGKRVGVSCTASGMDPEWCNRQICPTVVLHRDVAEIEASWRRIGVIPMFAKQPLDAVAGWHVDWRAPRDLDQAKQIYQHLLWKDMDEERWKELVQMHVEPHFTNLRVGSGGIKELTDRMRQELSK